MAFQSCPRAVGIYSKRRQLLGFLSWLPLPSPFDRHLRTGCGRCDHLSRLDERLLGIYQVLACMRELVVNTVFDGPSLWDCVNSTDHLQ